MPATPKGKEKVPSRNMIIEILLFKLVELIIVFLNLVGSCIKKRGRRKWYS